MKNINWVAYLFLSIALALFQPKNSAAQVDMGALSLFAPDQKICYSSTEAVTVRIKNYSASAHSFVTNPVTVSVSVLGPNPTTFTPVVVNTGSLAAGDSLAVAISTNYNMTATGTYTFNASTSVTGDVNAGNNAMPASSVVSAVLVAGTVAANPSSYCGTGGTPTLTLTGGSGGSIQWQESPSGVAGSWTNVGTNNTTYTPSTAITATRYYRAYRKCNANADTSTVVTVSLSSPQLLSSTPATRCGPGTLTLAATSSAGSTIHWFNAPQGGALLGTGNSFTTPSISSTTTYYTAAWLAATTSVAGVKVADFPICGTPQLSATVDQPLRFTTTKPILLNSVYVVPQSTSVTIALRAQNSTTNIVSQAFTFTTAQVGTPVQVNLNWSVAVPGNYQITNTVGGLGHILTLGCSYPFTSAGGGMSIVGSAQGSLFVTVSGLYNGFYQFSVTEGCESTPVPVVATVNDNTAITQQPVNVSTCAGSIVNLTVVAQGMNLVYQWRKNGANIANSNNDTLTFNPVSAADAGSYDVVITGLCGSAVTSNAVTVNVAAGNAWLGTVSNDWNATGNWCAGVPNSSSNVTVFGGTPFQPIITSGSIDVRSLTLGTGSTLTLGNNTTLNLYGDFVNSGNLVASTANVVFRGTLVQNIGSMNVNNATVNGSGVTLTGSMTVIQNLVLTNGNIALGNNNLTYTGSLTGTVSNHIVTNGTGFAISKNISTTAVTIPVGPDNASYNPVAIANGSGRDYSVRVATGITPTISNPGSAVNRTWTITPGGTGNPTNVNLTFQYDDSHMNSPGVATNTMEIGVHNGTSWAIAIPSVAPQGGSSARQVSGIFNQFGPTVVANIGGISWITSTTNVDPTMSSIKLLPNIVEAQTILRVTSTRSAKTRWTIIDANGRILMSFDKTILPGQNDLHIMMQHLAKGIYSLNGMTDKGVVATMKFVKQ